jgi:hypothetical protein
MMKRTLIKLPANLLVPSGSVYARSDTLSLELFRIELVYSGMASKLCIGHWECRGRIVKFIVPVPPVNNVLGASKISFKRREYHSTAGKVHTASIALPSSGTAWARAVLEAMPSGTCSIASNCAYVTWMFLDGSSNFVVSVPPTNQNVGDKKNSYYIIMPRAINK